MQSPPPYLFCLHSLTRLVATLLMSFITASVCAEAPDSMAGAWRGAIEIARPDGKPAYVYARLSFKQENRRLSGTIDSQIIGLATEPLQDIHLAGQQLTFKFELTGATAAAAVELKNGQFDGTYTWRGAKYRIDEVHVDFDANRNAGDFEGGYRTTDGRRLVLSAAMPNLSYFIPDTGEVGVLYSIAPDRYVHGPGLYRPAPVEQVFQFQRGTDGRVSGIVIQDASDKKAIQASPAPLYSVEELTFQSGGNTLHGWLRIPAQAGNPGGKLPAILLLQGSGAEDHRAYYGDFDFLADRLAAVGIAAFSYDKEGVGQSQGNSDADVPTLALDAGAAFEALRKDARIDPSRVGIYGHSQGAIIEPLVAAAHPDIAVLIDSSGSVIDPGTQEILRTQGQMLADGYPQEEVASAVGLQILKFYYADHRIGWDSYMQAYRPLHDKPWFDMVVGSPDSQTAPGWDFWKKTNAVHPVDFWKQVGVPVLALYGEHDTLSPPQVQIGELKLAFTDERGKLLTVELVPGVEHNFYRAENGGPLEFGGYNLRDPLYYATIVRWLTTHDFGQNPADSH